MAFSFQHAFSGERPPDAPVVALETRRIGHLRLPSGRLVACDPFAGARARPFVRPVPVGEFPVDLVIAEPAGEARVALARIAFSPEPAVAWEPALPEGADPALAQAGGFFGYGVDTGTGAFFDAEAWQEYEERMARDPDGFSDFLYTELDRNDTGRFSWLVLPLGRGSVAMFSTGYGDGGYASYWGRDRRGRLAAIVTDFGVIAAAPPLP